eukprot:6150523-Prorocentrum_lima.AAC.1
MKHHAACCTRPALPRPPRHTPLTCSAQHPPRVRKSTLMHSCAARTNPDTHDDTMTHVPSVVHAQMPNAE